MRKLLGCCGVCWSNSYQEGWVRLIPLSLSWCFFQHSTISKGEAKQVTATQCQRQGYANSNRGTEDSRRRCPELVVRVRKAFACAKASALAEGFTEELASIILDMAIDRTPQLRELMQRSNISSLRQLYELTGTSASTINKLRSSQVATLRWQTLVNISAGLQISIDELLETFGDSSYESDRQKIATLEQEYTYLQQQLKQQRETLSSEFQHQSLQILESFLTYFPTAKQAAISNPDFPASKLVPLTRSIEQLIGSWGVTVIGAVGGEIVYDPQWHQLIEGAVNPGEIAIVRYVGYRQSDKAIFRAKVARKDD